jgi:hypothetical protein
MFETEAEEYRKDLKSKFFLSEPQLDLACQGFKDGCNKANEWHFVKDKLPIRTDSTLCELMPVFVAVKVGYKVSTYGTYWNLRLGKFECLDEVYAWCYTPEPPELKESE